MEMVSNGLVLGFFLKLIYKDVSIRFISLFFQVIIQMETHLR